jgi:hypothetical protein
MSQENVETVRRALEAWNADDLDAALAELHPDGMFSTESEALAAAGLRE